MSEMSQGSLIQSFEHDVRTILFSFRVGEQIEVLDSWGLQVVSARSSHPLPVPCPMHLLHVDLVGVYLFFLIKKWS
jgi:hypothetical protein